jgi:uncharacterized membrane protein YbaN (DUF454 family)
MKTAALKFTLNTIGTVALVLGIIGAFLPLLPTTPFLLLASACYARGSTRLHGWLLGSRVFGPTIRNFEAGKGIPRRAKITAIALLWLSLAWSATRVGHLLLLALLAAIGIGVTIYLLAFVPTSQPTAPGLA